MRRVLVRLLIAVALIAPAAATVSALPAQAAPPTLALSPSSGPPTTHVLAVGGFWTAGETIKVYFDTTLVATTTANSSGELLVGFNVPASAQPGTHVVKAVGQTSGKTGQHNFVVRTNWPQFRYNDPHSGFNTFENTVGPANVSTLTAKWTGEANGIIDYSSPAVANGLVYVGAEDSLLYAFPASGCGSSTCTPLFTGQTGGILYSSPAVAGGTVYVGSDDKLLYAFSTAGCASSPCAALFTGQTSGPIYSSPVVVNKVVYVGSNDHSLYAFSTSGCATPPCAPLWFGTTSGEVASSPAVANGVVFVGSYDNKLYAFSTAGCASSPCPPLWTGGTNDVIASSPAVANGVVYVRSTDGFLYAFSASGCGSPTCDPLWKAAAGPGGLFDSSPAVANGVVFVGSYDHKLYAFSTSTAACTGGPPTKTCLPLWTGTTTGAFSSSPAVANGVVYVGSFDNLDNKVYGFSASGTTGCSGNPKVCSPLWTATTATGNTHYDVYSSPAVANGVIYIGSGAGNPLNGKLYAFTLP